MIRMLIPLVIIFLAYILMKTFLADRAEEPINVDPIDVEPVDASTGRGDKQTQDDVIDVDPA